LIRRNINIHMDLTFEQLLFRQQLLFQEGIRFNSPRDCTLLSLSPQMLKSIIGN
jgi:hypothetical protein